MRMVIFLVLLQFKNIILSVFEIALKLLSRILLANTALVHNLASVDGDFVSDRCNILHILETFEILIQIVQ